MGEHDGTFGFTVGQRRGLGVSVGDQRPRYVLSIEPVGGRSRSGPREQAGGDRGPDGGADVDRGGPELPFRAEVQLRAHGAPVPCEVRADEDGGLRILLDEEQRGVAPGQSAVLYEPDPIGVTACSVRPRCDVSVNGKKRFVTDPWLAGLHRLAFVTSRFLSVTFLARLEYPLPSRPPHWRPDSACPLEDSLTQNAPLPRRRHRGGVVGRPRRRPGDRGRGSQAEAAGRRPAARDERLPRPHRRDSGGDSQIITGPGADGVYGTNPTTKKNDDKYLTVGGAAQVAATVDRLQSSFATATKGSGAS